MSTPHKHEVEVLDTNIATAIKTLAKSLGVAVYEGRMTCLHCRLFDEGSETCMLWNAKPPARVVAFGCDQFSPSDIPF